MACCGNAQLCVQHGQHRQEFAGAEFGAAPTLKARERFGCHTGERGHCGLLEAKRFAPLGDGKTEFGKSLQLIFVSSFYIFKLKMIILSR